MSARLSFPRRGSEHRPPQGARRRAWRRVQARRALAAVLAGLAWWVALGILAPDPPPGMTVLVAAGPLPAGHVLGPQDLLRRTYSPDAVPRAAIRDDRSLVGRHLASPLDAGELLTTTRVGASALLAGQASGTRAVHVPVADPGALARLGPGDRVDVVAVADGSVVVGAAVVLAIDDTSAGPHAERARGLTLAVPESRVGPLTSAALDAAGRGGVHLAQRP